jgi:hypothetical protein
MILSAVIFVGSAMGVEIVHDFLKVINGGKENMYLEFLICLEEIGEMTGTIIFIYTLLTYIAAKKIDYFYRNRELISFYLNTPGLISLSAYVYIKNENIFLL